ncbi:LytTR family transcriptional regulator DNA-binding domain-containing protein (plasmid) [Bacillus sp. F19]|nr:LytTR family transcriptional regulator DNA-binding domain-containing protein [Bacillus sp. F19]
MEGAEPINCNDNLGVLEQVLGSKGFYRTHQSYLVPLSKIEEILPDNYMKSYNLKLKNCPAKIEVSRTKYKELKKELQKILYN